MKRIFTIWALLCLLTASASATYIPENVIEENRDGRQLIIKTFNLAPTDDPSGLAEDPFTVEGYRYTHLETVKEEKTFQNSKQHTETVTVSTDSDDLETILAQLSATMEYSKDGYSGILSLDHTTMLTEAAGYTTKSYTITDTREYTGLDRNDPAYIPTTSMKNGATLTLSSLTWAVTGTGLANDTLVPTSYTATATYTTKGSRQVATGYITTAKYSGEITAQGISSVCYTVTYLGTPVEPQVEIIPDDPSRPVFIWMTIILAISLAATLVVLLWMVFRPNAVIYAMNGRGVAYKKLGQQRLTVRQPKLDFTRLREYPAGEASVELSSRVAHKLAGRLVTIQLYDGSRTHLVEPYEGDENYWFAVREDENGKETPEL